MNDIYSIGHNRPPYEGPTQVGERKKVRDILRQLAAHHLSSIEENEKLNPCCRKVKDHDVSFYRTHIDAEKPDLMIFQCQCGRSHYRLACGGGKLEDPKVIIERAEQRAAAIVERAMQEVELIKRRA